MGWGGGYFGREEGGCSTYFDIASTILGSAGDEVFLNATTVSPLIGVMCALKEGAWGERKG